MIFLLPPFLFGEKALGKRLPKVHLEILKRDRLEISAYGLSAMNSELHIVGSFIRILSEKSLDISCGGGNEARERLNNLAYPTVGQSRLGNLRGPVQDENVGLFVQKAGENIYFPLRSCHQLAGFYLYLLLSPSGHQDSCRDKADPHKCLGPPPRLSTWTGVPDLIHLHSRAC